MPESSLPIPNPITGILPVPGVGSSTKTDEELASDTLNPFKSISWQRLGEAVLGLVLIAVGMATLLRKPVEAIAAKAPK
jgi:hypothetical protein